MSIKPYFRPETTYDVKPDELEVTAELDKLKVTAELDKLKAPAKSNKLEVLLPTLKVPQKPTKPIKPAIKRSQRHPRKYPVTKNPVIENYLTSAGISTRQSPPTDISVLVQETPFTDLRRKEINRLLKKGVFAVIIERDVP